MSKETPKAQVPDLIGRQRAWVRSAMEKTGLSATALAKVAGLAPTTLTRFLRAGHRTALSATTIAAIEVVSGLSLHVASAKSPAAMSPADCARLMAHAGAVAASHALAIIALASDEEEAWLIAVFMKAFCEGVENGVDPRIEEVPF